MARTDERTGVDSGSSPGLSVELHSLVHEACDTFEGKWKGRGRPDIWAALLELPEDLWPVALRELIRLDVYYRRRRGESPVAADYAGRFSDLDLDADWLDRVCREDGPNAPPVPPFPSPGSRFGKYAILEQLGRGGMGVVFRARQDGLNRDVALKMLLAGAFAAPALRARFLHEAVSMAALEHPHIIKVFEVDECAGYLYIAMEYHTGGTLADRVRASGSLPGTEAAGWVAKLAAAVAHAHSREVVHRDIKPGNVLFGADGEPRLADFGLAKFGRCDGKTMPGQVLGTPAFMSPEQAAGKVNEVGTHSDVYALGAVLYDLLTAHPPFKADSDAVTLQKVISEEPERPRALVRSVPRDLETICLACLEKNPKNRYPTAQELADELRRYLRHEPILRRPIGPSERAVKWVRRNKVLAGAAGAVAGALLAGTAVSVAYAVKAHDSLDLAEARGADLTAANARLRESLDRRRAEAYPDAIRLARLAWEHGDSARARAALDRCLPGADEPDLRSFEWHYLDACLRESDRLLTTHAAPLLTADVSPNGRLVASGDQSGVVKVTELATGREVRTFRYSQLEVTAVRFSPDGRFLATAGMDRNVWIWDVADWAKVQRLEGHSRTVTGVAWGPHGHRIASSGRDEVVKVWDTLTGTPVRDFPHPDVVGCVAWTPGNVLLTGCADNHVRMYDPESGDELKTFAATGGKALALAWNKETGIFASGGYEHQAHVYSLGLKKQLLVPNSRGQVWSLTFGLGRHLIGGQTGRIQVWNHFPDSSVTYPLRTVTHAGRVRAVVVTPDWGHLVTASEQPAEVRVRLASSVLGYSHSRFRGEIPAVSSRGDWAAIASASRRVYLRGVLTPKPSRGLPGHAQGSADLVFSPDGEQLFTVDSFGAVVAWNTADPTKARVVIGRQAQAASVTLSPDGVWAVAKSATGEAHVARQATGEVVKVLPAADRAWGECAFSADGTTFASANDRVVTVWRVGTWERLADFDLHHLDQPVGGLALSPDGRLLAAGGKGHSLTLWVVHTKKNLPLLSDHPGPVHSLAFSADGRTLATAGEDGTVRLWHVATGRELFVLLRNPPGSLLWVRFVSPTRLAVGARSLSRGRCEVLAFPPTDGVSEW